MTKPLMLLASPALQSGSVYLVMIFNSVAYLFFLPLVVVTYYLLTQKWRQYLLVSASLFFYSFWSLNRSGSWPNACMTCSSRMACCSSRFSLISPWRSGYRERSGRSDANGS